MTVVGLSELLRFKRVYVVDLVQVWGLTVWVAIWRGGGGKLLLAKGLQGVLGRSSGKQSRLAF